MSRVDAGTIAITVEGNFSALDQGIADRANRTVAVGVAPRSDPGFATMSPGVAGAAQSGADSLATLSQSIDSRRAATDYLDRFRTAQARYQSANVFTADQSGGIAGISSAAFQSALPSMGITSASGNAAVDRFAGSGGVNSKLEAAADKLANSMLARAQAEEDAARRVSARESRAMETAVIRYGSPDEQRASLTQQLGRAAPGSAAEYIADARLSAFDRSAQETRNAATEQYRNLFRSTSARLAAEDSHDQAGEFRRLAHYTTRQLQQADQYRDLFHSTTARLAEEEETEGRRRDSATLRYGSRREQREILARRYQNAPAGSAEEVEARGQLNEFLNPEPRHAPGWSRHFSDIVRGGFALREFVNIADAQQRWAQQDRLATGAMQNGGTDSGAILGNSLQYYNPGSNSVTDILRRGGAALGDRLRSIAHLRNPFADANNTSVEDILRLQQQAESIDQRTASIVTAGNIRTGLTNQAIAGRNAAAMVNVGEFARATGQAEEQYRLNSLKASSDAAVGYHNTMAAGRGNIATAERAALDAAKDQRDAAVAAATRANQQDLGRLGVAAGSNALRIARMDDAAQLSDLKGNNILIEDAELDPVRRRALGLANRSGEQALSEQLGRARNVRRYGIASSIYANDAIANNRGYDAQRQGILAQNYSDEQSAQAEDIDLVRRQGGSRLEALRKQTLTENTITANRLGSENASVTLRRQGFVYQSAMKAIDAKYNTELDRVDLSAPGGQAVWNDLLDEKKNAQIDADLDRRRSVIERSAAINSGALELGRNPLAAQVARLNGRLQADNLDLSPKSDIYKFNVTRTSQETQQAIQGEADTVQGINSQIDAHRQQTQDLLARNPRGAQIDAIVSQARQQALVLNNAGRREQAGEVLKNIAPDLDLYKRQYTDSLTSRSFDPFSSVVNPKQFQSPQDVFNQIDRAKRDNTFPDQILSADDAKNKAIAKDIGDAVATALAALIK